MPAIASVRGICSCGAVSGVARLPLSSLSGAGHARDGARDPLDLYLDGALLQLEPSFAGVGGEVAAGLGASTMVPAAAYAEAARLRDEARQQALLANEEVLRRLAYLEEQVSVVYCLWIASSDGL